MIGVKIACGLCKLLLHFCTPIVFISAQVKGANLKKPLREQRRVFGVRIKIMYEEQLVDTLIHYIY